MYWSFLAISRKSKIFRRFSQKTAFSHNFRLRLNRGHIFSHFIFEYLLHCLFVKIALLSPLPLHFQRKNRVFSTLQLYLEYENEENVKKWHTSTTFFFVFIKNRLFFPKSDKNFKCGSKPPTQCMAFE